MPEIVISQATPSRPHLPPIAVVADGFLDLLSPCGAGCVCRKYARTRVLPVALGQTRLSNYGFRTVCGLVLSNVPTDSQRRGIPLARRALVYEEVLGILQRVGPPCVPRVLDFCRCCTEMGYIEGFQLLDNALPWTPQQHTASCWADRHSTGEFEQLLLDLLRAAVALHQIGVVHSDIVANNVLIHPTTADFRIVDLCSCVLLQEDADIEIEIRQMQTFLAECVGRRWSRTWDVGRLYTQVASAMGFSLSGTLRNRLDAIGTSTLDQTLDDLVRDGLVEAATVRRLRRRWSAAGALRSAGHKAGLGTHSPMSSSFKERLPVSAQRVLWPVLRTVGHAGLRLAGGIISVAVEPRASRVVPRLLLAPPVASANPVQARFAEHEREEVGCSDLSVPRCAWYHTRAARIFDAVIQQAPGGRLLDLGCGPGDWTYHLEHAGFEVVAIDICRDAILYARQRAAANFVQGDMRCLPIKSATFDVILASEVIEHSHAPAEFLAEASRLLRPDGLLVLTSPNGGFVLNGLPSYRESVSDPKFWAHEFGPDGDTHFFHLTPAELEAAVRTAGLGVMSHRFYGSQWVTLQGSLRHPRGMVARYLSVKARLWLDGRTAARHCDGQLVVAVKPAGTAARSEQSMGPSVR